MRYSKQGHRNTTATLDAIIQNLRARVRTLEAQLAETSADLLRARLEIDALLERRNAA